MEFQPAVGNRPMHRRAVFVDVATRAQECMVDRADSYPASMIGLKPICNFEQLRQCGFRISERAVFLEFHCRCFRSYPASASALASAYSCAFAMSSSVSPARIRDQATLN